MAVGAGALMTRLAQGPVAIDGLSERIAAELGARIGASYTVALKGSTIERVGAGLRLALDGLAVHDSTGRPVFVAPRGSVSVAIAPLLMGRVKPVKIEVYDVRLGLTARPDGAWAVSAGAEPVVLAPADERGGAPSESHESAPVLSLLARSLGEVLNLLSDEASPVARMEKIQISGGRLTLEDQASGRSTIYDKLELGFDRDGGKASLALSAEGPGGRWQATASAIDAKDAGSGRAVEIEVRDLNFEDIAPFAGIRAPEAYFDMPLSARVRVALGGDGAVAGVNARFNAASGYIYARDEDFEPVFVEQITGGFRWDAASGFIEIEPTQWAAGDTQLTVSGRITPPAAPDGPWRIEGQTAPGSVLGAEQPADARLSMDDARLAINVFPGRRQMILENLSVAGPDADLRLTGDLDWSEASRRLRLKLTAGRTKARAAMRIWPVFIAPPVHVWLLGHLDGGTLEQGELTLDFDGPAIDNALKKRPPDDERVQMDFTISGAVLRFLPGVPPLSGLDVTGHTTGHTVLINARKAGLEGAPGHRVALTEGSFKVADTTLHPAPAQIAARIAGSVDAVVDVLSREGLRPFIGSLGDTSAVKGQVEGRLFVDLMLDKKPRPEETQVRANASVSDFTVDKLIGKERFEQGQLTLTVDKAGMRAVGAGKLFGAPAQIEFKKLGAGALDANIAFTLDDSARSRLAPAFANGVNGPITARIASVVAKEPAPAHVELDFTKASLDNALPGLVKAAGRPAKASFRLQTQADGAHIDQLAFDASTGAAMRGTIDLDANGNLRAAHLSQMRLSPSDDMKVDAEQGKDGLKLVVRGASIDARPFLQGVFSSEPKSRDNKAEGAGADLDIDLRSSLATGYNRQSFSNVDFHMTRKGGAIRAMRLRAMAGSSAVTISTPPGGAGALSVNSLDGGAVFSFVDLYRRMEGGRLRANLQMTDKGVAGSVFVSDFILRDEPALRRLVSEGGPKTGDPLSRKIDTTAAPFQRLSATFTRDRGELRVADGVLYGAQIGIKLDGTLNYAGNKVDMSGTYVPAYGLNNLLTQIPLFGPILGGGTHEGIFAVNFRVSGPATAPSLVINPLSAIAPGFLRKIFGAGSAPPPTAAPEDAPSTIPRSD